MSRDSASWLREIYESVVQSLWAGVLVASDRNLEPSRAPSRDKTQIRSKYLGLWLFYSSTSGLCDSPLVRCASGASDIDQDGTQRSALVDLWLSGITTWYQCSTLYIQYGPVQGRRHWYPKLCIHNHHILRKETDLRKMTFAEVNGRLQSCYIRALSLSCLNSKDFRSRPFKCVLVPAENLYGKIEFCR